MLLVAHRDFFKHERELQQLARVELEPDLANVAQVKSLVITLKPRENEFRCRFSYRTGLLDLRYGDYGAREEKAAGLWVPIQMKLKQAHRIVLSNRRKSPWSEPCVT